MSDDQRQSGGTVSLAQQGMWLHEQRRDLRAAYHLPFTLSFRGGVDRAALLDACRAVVARNPILTSAIRENGTVPCLVPAEHSPEIALVDFGEAPAAEIDTLLADAIRRDIGRTFDLSSGPLIRMTLFALSTSAHVLLVVPHHLVFDGLSVDLFKRELAECYRALLTGEALGPAAPYSAQDYAAEEARLLAADLPAAREFWRERWLEPGEVALPGAMCAPHEISAGECVAFSLDRRQHACFKEAASEIGVTAFEFLLASLYALLRRYGNTTPVIGVTLGLRTKETMNSIGFFSHEVPLAQRVDPALTFRDFAAALRADLRQLYRFRRIPVSRAVTGVSPAATQAPVIISYRRHDRTVEFPGAQATAEWQFNFAARGALWIQVLDESENLRVYLRYAPRVIARDSVERIGGHWQNLLDGAAASPASRLGALPLLAPKERDQQLASRHPSSHPITVSSTATWPALFSAQVARGPDRIAVICGENEITYRRLDAASDGLAQRLRCSDVGRESVVLIRAQPSIGMLTALLAVHKAGAAYLALAPGCPVSVIAMVAASTGACALLGDDLVLDGTPMSGKMPVISLDERGCACGHCPPDVASGPHSATLASLIGTYAGQQADRPSWVAIEHGALASRLNALRGVTRTGPEDTWLAQSSPAAGISAIELFLPLTAGARVVIAQEKDKEATRLLQFIRRHRITHVQAAPTAWRLLLDAGFDEPGVTAVADGGMLSPALARRLHHRVRTLLSAYGQPETAAWPICGEVPRDALNAVTGRPIPGTRCHVLDERAGTLPIGSIGELCIGGPAVARGYVGDPATTAERFVADPYGTPGSRLFRTGLRARYRPDGDIEFLGRIDDSVILRGRRIDLGRIEARLAAHPGIEECAVALGRSSDANPGVAAYFVPAAGNALSTAELETWLTETLPSFMTPTAYVTLDQFPQTADGTIDTERMQKLASRNGSQPTEEKHPYAAQEIQDVTRIFREIPRLKDLDPDEDMFSFGVNSLTIAQIAARIRMKLKVDIPAENFYENPTIIEIASMVTKARARERGSREQAADHQR
jgi:amino acid adenylation domain-containing protein